MDTAITEITKHYTVCALWSSTDDAGTPLDDAKYANTELAEETKAKFAKDCAAFWAEYVELLKAHGHSPDEFTESRVGHDFWLTRNRHGSGFWDGDWPKPLDDKLTEIAHRYGECDLYIGDDGKIYAA